MEESQTSSDLQAMITAAVAVTMEKASSKSLLADLDTPKPFSKRVHYRADSEDSDSSRECSHRPKRLWKGEAAAPHKSKGKDAEPTHALAVLDEWQVAVKDNHLKQI
ncbi:Hypothetical predicted protein [Pelobates cultripes]|uniref:Uncharacterized protein n=1 Tax=Pelobates cultripes TaxID=61616 RepID=A0AAD1QYP2_PELCU|nr:Hypothetical predicted protein [Pelobates cultripes]